MHIELAIICISYPSTFYVQFTQNLQYRNFHTLSDVFQLCKYCNTPIKTYTNKVPSKVLNT